MKNAFESVRPRCEEQPSATPPRYRAGPRLTAINPGQEPNERAKPAPRAAAAPRAAKARKPREPRPRATGRTELIRQLLRECGPMDSAEIVLELDIPSRALVGALLSADLRAGRAAFEGGLYRWCGSTDQAGGPAA